MSRLPPILILNTNLPVFPGGGGVEALTTRHLAGLSERVGLVSMAHTAAQLERAEPLAKAGVRFYLWKHPALEGSASPAGTPDSPGLRARLAPWLQAFVDWLRAGPDRPADTFVLDRGLRNLSSGLWRAWCEQEWPIVSVVESTAASFLDALPRPRLSVLVMHDVRSLMYERQAAQHSGRVRSRLHREARRYRAFEARWCREYDVVATVSEHDARWVAEHYRPRRTIAVPLPVDAGYFAPAPPEAEQAGRIVFTGQMNHPPNADAAVFFAREVLPRVRAAVPDAHFQVVGRSPLADVLALRALPGVEVTGEVPDVRPHLAAASVVVVPLRFGSGARQKILEAWCLRKCIVSTTVGAEGLDARAGENLLLADGPEALAAQVACALRDPDLRDRVRSAGRELALARHDPVRVAEGYASELQAALVERPPSSGLRAVVDLRHLEPTGDDPLQRAGRALLRGLAQAPLGSGRVTVLLPRAMHRAWPGLRRDGLAVVCEDDLTARVRRFGSRAWQALRGILGIFRDSSEELAWLRRLRRLDARVLLATAAPASDLLPLRLVLLLPDTAILPDAALLTRARRVIVASAECRDRLIAQAGLDPRRVVALAAGAEASAETLLGVLLEVQKE